MYLRLIKQARAFRSEPNAETNSAAQPTLKRQNSTETLDTPARKRFRETNIAEILSRSPSRDPPAPAQKVDIQPSTEEVRAQMAKLANVW
jgi:hypothetical protein